MRQVSGVITVVQEHRFELRDGDGTHRHFTLAHDAPLGWSELAALEREGCPVTVMHSPARAGHTSCPAHAVLRTGGPAVRKGSP